MRYYKRFIQNNEFSLIKKKYFINNLNEKNYVYEFRSLAKKFQADKLLLPIGYSYILPYY